MSVSGGGGSATVGIASVGSSSIGRREAVARGGGAAGARPSCGGTGRPGERGAAVGSAGPYRRGCARRSSGSSGSATRRGYVNLGNRGQDAEVVSRFSLIFAAFPRSSRR